MMMNIKKCISVFTLFLAVFVAFYFLLKVTKDTHIDELLCEQQKYLEISYKQGLDRFNVIADNVYMSLQNDKEFVRILSGAKEKKLKQVHDALYVHIKDEFHKLQQFGVMGLQIILPNNISLVRMHKPDKYGDNLSKMRYSLQYVNENKVHLSGFEEGRSSHAFREIYPLYNKGIYIGAVEIFFSSTILQDYTMRTSSIHTHFIVNKNVFKTTAWKSKIAEPYMRSIE
ncbi:MAG: hypothetical protein J7L21_05520, partial [Sulfurimonas sp.]|nr:hypothetical protein [Sulfurimonas sp.]